LSEGARQKVRSLRKKTPSTQELIKGILEGNKTALAQAITLVESTNPDHSQQANDIIDQCLSHSTQSIRIGITGVPGVGKSSFIESFGGHLISLGKKLAVLAVDPSSSISKGSILGDKTRMQELVKNPDVFIRPSPSGTSIGGVARKTRESIILCEAASYEVILIETVGVGQSETAVHGMVDFFLLLQLAGAGDELQGIKRGIVEMADAIVINKADGDNIKRAQLAKGEYQRALHLYPPKENGWVPQVLDCSSIESRGIKEIWELLDRYFTETRRSGHFQENRRVQNRYWFLQTVEDLLKLRFYGDRKVQKQLKKWEGRVMDHEISPFRAAAKLLEFQQKELK
tara:strand:- start:9067 stop:10095 length:1029 start_codon:yes stop_codon:yes gene_type:complete